MLPVYVIKGMDDSVSILKDRYVRLGTFQEISPEEKTIIARKEVDENQASLSSGTSILSTHQKYTQLDLSEEKILHEDINTYLSDTYLSDKD